MPSAEERKEDVEREVKREEESNIIEEDGVIIEAGEDTLGDFEAAVQLGRDENSGQRVIEVDTSDEESDLDQRDAKDFKKLKSLDKEFCLRDSEPGREVVVDVESDDEEPVLEDMDSMGTGLSDIPVVRFT